MARPSLGYGRRSISPRRSSSAIRPTRLDGSKPSVAHSWREVMPGFVRHQREHRELHHLETVHGHAFHEHLDDDQRRAVRFVTHQRAQKARARRVHGGGGFRAQGRRGFAGAGHGMITD